MTGEFNQRTRSEQSTSNAMLSCPFCGYAVDETDVNGYGELDGKDADCVCCPECQNMGPMAFGKNGAIAAWNKRHAHEPPSEHDADLATRACQLISAIMTVAYSASPTQAEAALLSIHKSCVEFIDSDPMPASAQPPPPEYSQAEQDCKGCMGPCGQCEQPDDNARLAWIGGGSMFDELCGVDVHEKAASIADIAGREEPNEDDLAAAARYVIDAAMAEDASPSTKGGE